MKQLPTIDRLHELLELDPSTGDLTAIVGRKRRVAGEKAGFIRKDGYRRVCIDYMRISAHRIVWAMTYGSWPSMPLDHINGIRDDNRPANLREATVTQNRANSGLHITNTSGYPGVSWSKKLRKWKAGIQRLGKHIHLGYYDDPEMAGYAYKSAQLKYFGEFARAA